MLWNSEVKVFQDKRSDKVQIVYKVLLNKNTSLSPPLKNAIKAVQIKSLAIHITNQNYVLIYLW